MKPGYGTYCLCLLGALGSECGSENPGPIEVFREYTGQGGGVRYVEVPDSEDMFNSDLSDGIVIQSQEELNEFLNNRPSILSEPDELDKAKIDFSKRMLIVVIRQDMYDPPKVTRILRNEHSVDVYYVLPTLAETEELPRLGFACTYRALEVKRASLPIVFKREK